MEKWNVGMLEKWKVGKVESWSNGKLETVETVGTVETVETVESWNCGIVRSVQGASEFNTGVYSCK